MRRAWVRGKREIASFLVVCIIFGGGPYAGARAEPSPAYLSETVERARPQKSDARRSKDLARNTSPAENSDPGPDASPAASDDLGPETRALDSGDPAPESSPVESGDPAPESSPVESGDPAPESSPVESGDPAPRPNRVDRKEAYEGGASVFAVDQKPDRPRSVFFMPLLSFLLPGFDQWLEGQWLSATAYTGVALGGLAYSESVRRADHIGKPQNQSQQDKSNETSESQEEQDTTLDSKDVALRKYTLGYLIYQGAGGMSAYHSFRTAVRTRRAKGEYNFLKDEETPLDILQAPFHFEYLTRPTTFIPLSIAAAYAYIVAVSEPPKEYEKSRLSSADWFFTGAYSYNAGTHEEAMFRGWLMPVLAQNVMNPFWSNVSQAGIFALAHLSTNSFPLPQLILGYHLGYVTQKRGWHLGESVFIHVWWDVLAFASTFSYSKKQKDAAARLIPPPVLWLPPLTWHF